MIAEENIRLCIQNDKDQKGISQNDLYQMLAYEQDLNVDEKIILFFQTL